MSGGHLCDYSQYRIEDIAKNIEEQIARNNRRDNPYNEETIREFIEAVKILRKSFIYAQRIDWLVSGDDCEESFHSRLQEELDKL